MDQFGQAAGALIHRSVPPLERQGSVSIAGMHGLSSSSQTLHAAQQGFCLPLALIYFY